MFDLLFCKCAVNIKLPEGTAWRVEGFKPLNAGCKAPLATTASAGPPLDQKYVDYSILQI